MLPVLHTIKVQGERDTNLFIPLVVSGVGERQDFNWERRLKRGGRREKEELQVERMKRKTEKWRMRERKGVIVETRVLNFLLPN